MLRRRILTSAMASVMAISSVAVVANADDAVAAVEKQVMEKEDLKAVLDKYASERDKALDDYGSVSGEDFLDALEYAENVLDDAESTKADYTVAALMVEGAHAHLAKKSQQELRDLIKECRAIYDKGNILNEDLGDLRYTEGSFETFEQALGDAESVLDSSDSRLWTDTWFDLKDAKDSLSKMNTVTKADFRKALKAYDAAIAKKYAYEPWRIGTESKGNEVAYGVWYTALSAISKRVHDRYNDIDEIKGLYETSQTEIVQACNDVKKATEEFNKWTPDDTDRANKANVSKLLSQYHGRLVRDYNNTTGANDTTAWGLLKSIVTAINPDNKDRTVEVEVPKNMSEQTGSTFRKATELIEDNWGSDDIDQYITSYSDRIWYITYQKNVKDDIKGGSPINKLLSAAVNVKVNQRYYIPIGDDGYWTGDVVTTNVNQYPKFKTVNAKTVIDLSQFIPVTAPMVDHDTANNLYNGVIDSDGEAPKVWNKDSGWSLSQNPQILDSSDETIFSNELADMDECYTDLGTAIELAYFYLNGNSNPEKFLEGGVNKISLIDSNDTIAEGSAKGSTSEWTLVNRYLSYALADKYATSKGNLKTKVDVKNLIDQSYDITDVTGDATLFSENHQNLVAIRKTAIKWLADVNKMKRYADNIDAGIWAEDGKTETYLVANEVYKKLNDAYVALEQDYKTFNCSFGDVYDYIYDVCSKVDDGTLQLTDEMKASIQETAYRLSVIANASEDENWLYHDGGWGANGPTGDPIDNDAFTSDRYFLPYNRLFTDLNSQWWYQGKGPAQILITSNTCPATRTHVALKQEFDKLQAEVKKQTDPEVALGDVNGDKLVNAMDAAEILKACVSLRDPIDVKVGDVNADGKVDQMDAVKILKQSAGITD